MAWQTKITRARFNTSGLTAPALVRIGQAFVASQDARLGRGENIYDLPAKPLTMKYKEYWADLKSGGRKLIGFGADRGYRSQKLKKGLKAIRDWWYTGRTRRSIKVLSASENRVVIGPTDDVVAMRIRVNNARDRQYGISPRDRQAIGGVVAAERTVEHGGPAATAMSQGQRGHVSKPTGKRTTWGIIYRDPDGVQRWEGKFANRKTAQSRLTEILEQIRTERYVRRDPVTFAKFPEEWLTSRLRIRGSTTSSYGSLINARWVPLIGEVLLSDLRLERIERAVRDMIGEELETKTIHNAVTLLRTMLAGGTRGKGGVSAIRRGYIARDPTIGLELPELLKREIIPPSQDQVWHLIDVAKAAGGTGYPITFLVAHTGLRRNEALALAFDDIDWFAKELRVRRAVSLAKGTDGAHKWQWVIGEVKSRRSRRRIALTESTLRMLSDLRQVTGDGLLFPGPDSAHLNPDIFDAEIWAPIATAAGLPDTRFHDLRHFFASQLIAQRETAAYVRDQMGHSSIQVTYDTYGHLFPGAKSEAAARFEKAMGEAKANREKSVRTLLELSGDDGQEKPVTN